MAYGPANECESEFTMKMISEYLEHALSFELMAAEATTPELKAQFEKQAKAYRKLATERAERIGLPTPSTPDDGK
jgi:hypothetical protein